MAGEEGGAVTAGVSVVSNFLKTNGAALVGGLLGRTCTSRRIMLVRGRFNRVNVSNNFLGRTKVRVHRVGSKYVYYSLIKSFNASLGRIISGCRPSEVLVRPSNINGLSSIVGTMRNIRKSISVILGDCAAMISTGGYGVCVEGFNRFFSGRIRCTNTVVVDHASVVSRGGTRRTVRLLHKVGTGTTVVAAPVRGLSKGGVLRIVRGPMSLRRRLVSRRRMYPRYKRMRRRKRRRSRSRSRRYNYKRSRRRRRRRRRSRSRRYNYKRSRRRRRRRRRSRSRRYNYKRSRRSRRRRRTSRMFAD